MVGLLSFLELIPLEHCHPCIARSKNGRVRSSGDAVAEPEAPVRYATQDFTWPAGIDEQGADPGMRSAATCSPTTAGLLSAFTTEGGSDVPKPRQPATTVVIISPEASGARIQAPESPRNPGRFSAARPTAAALDQRGSWPSVRRKHPARITSSTALGTGDVRVTMPASVSPAGRPRHHQTSAGSPRGQRIDNWRSPAQLRSRMSDRLAAARSSWRRRRRGPVRARFQPAPRRQSRPRPTRTGPS